MKLLTDMRKITCVTAPVDVHCNGHITEGIYQLSAKPADTWQCKQTLHKLESFIFCSTLIRHLHKTDVDL